LLTVFLWRTLLSRIAAAAHVPWAVMHLAQSPTQRLDLALVGELLAFSHFHQLENFFHLIHGALQRLHDVHHFVNGLTDGGAAWGRFKAGHALGQALDALW
jgi:hypothetical protein